MDGDGADSVPAAVAFALANLQPHLSRWIHGAVSGRCTFGVVLPVDDIAAKR
jgi:hypothetical protein